MSTKVVQIGNSQQNKFRDKNKHEREIVSISLAIFSL
jgi:hypothetical protein